MKKLIVAIIALFFATSTAFANVKIGVSGAGAEFSDAAGHEEHKGVVTSESAEIGAVYGSIFIEANVKDIVSIGLDIIPYSIEGETVSNERRDAVGGRLGESTGTVDIENHTTLYLLKQFGDGPYIKLGASYADAVITESNKDNTTYPNDELFGGHLSVGFEKDLDTFFIRAEAGVSEYTTVVSKSSSGNTTIKASLNDGVHARISVGKNF